MGFFDRLKIAHKLPLMLVGSAMLVAGGVGVVSYFIGSDTVGQLTRNQIQTIAETRAKSFENYLAGIEEDLVITASGKVARAGLVDLSADWSLMAGAGDPSAALQQAYITDNPNPAGQRHLLDSASGMATDAYNRTHAELHPELRHRLEQSGYYDIFLFDAEGDLIYSVYKEADFATNFAAGQFANSGLGRAYQRASAMTEPGKVAFEDLSPYEASGNALAMFIATPVFDGARRIGVMAFQMSVAEIDAMMNDRTGLGGTGETFFVGTDFKLRNDTGTEGAEALAAEHGGPVVEAALAGTPGIELTQDYRGHTVLAAATPLEFNGTKWAFVTTIAEDEATGPVVAMGSMMLLTGAALLLLATIGGYFVSRSIARPIGKMTGTMQTLGGGDLTVKVEGGERGDELGAMARAVEVFRDNGLKVAEMTEAEAARIIATQAERVAMMQALQRAFGAVVDAAIAGDFAKRVETEFPDEELNTLARSVNNLVATVDRGVGETGEVLAALADTDLTKRMVGEYQGAFAKLKADTNAVAEKLTDIVGQLKDTSRTLKTATGEILSGANDLSERTTKQAATIEETSAAMEQLAVTVQQNADRARGASEVASTVTRTAEEGGTVMHRATEAMERITQSSGKISNIIGLIDDIAFQTNLLALNASVEAARAGDAGNGFAVVAVEVRRLAQSAASASADVKVLIEQSAGEVSSGSKLVADAAAKLESMLSAARSSNELMSGIAQQSREQASAIDEVTVAVRQMDEMTQHNAALVEEINAAIEQTEAQASELDRIVDVFAINETGAGRANAAPVRATAKTSQTLPGKLKSMAQTYLSQGNAAVAKDWSEF